ncbi:Kelch repeat-containing protein [Mucilaginibacter sp. KACC 22063]|uniref:Kelch repeat-containing protein n=1 Tax=Mucilaginibacter sp. KACC 22063 TaxID=3025666 RepID=UPI002366A95C|nr:kelch repeat-containing protein [Mucilaginibacter sp. KACC 22063]WDF55250.1 kelch repeat-containing protein [Mucilaginibacter sp. KACC 22063]
MTYCLTIFKLKSLPLALALGFISFSLPGKHRIMSNRFISFEVYSLLIQDQSGSPIPFATLTNTSQNYSRPFDNTGKMELESKDLKADDNIIISCLGYQTKNLKGLDIMSVKSLAVTLKDDIVSLHEVKIIPSKYDLIFKNIQALPFPLYYQAYATDGRYAYTIGGESGATVCTQALKFDPHSNTWSLLANHLKPTIQSTATYLPISNKIYVFGGITSLVNFTYFENVETIDVNTGKVEILNVKNPMPSAYGGSDTWANKIYLFGGCSDINNYTSSKATNDFYEYDPVTNVFTRLPNMPEKLQTSGRIINGILYILGGFNPQNAHISRNIYSYNIREKYWKLLGKLPEEVSGNGLSAIGNLIFVSGGYEKETFLGFLNTQTGEFTKLKSNMTGRRHSASVILYNHLMIIGGKGDGNITGLNNVQVANLESLITNQ